MNQSASTREVPVLCLDTCSIIDALRDPTKSGISVDELRSSMFLIHSVGHDAALEVRVAEQVQVEYENVVNKEEDMADRALAKLKSLVLNIDNLAKLFGNEPLVNLDHWSDLVAQCRSTADQWFRIAKLESTSDIVKNRAHDRWRRNIPPGRKGEGYGDCLILETYLAYVRKLRQKSDRVVVFVSSNTRDYASKNKFDVAVELREEFDSLDLKYAPNMRVAQRLLGFVNNTT